MLKGEAEMSPSNKKFYMNIIEVGGKLVYKYHVATGESITLELSNKELKDNIRHRLDNTLGKTSAAHLMRHTCFT